MSLRLEEYDEALRDSSPEIRDVLEATFQEASRVMSPADGLVVWLSLYLVLFNIH